MQRHNLNEFVKPDSELFRILRKLPKPDESGPWIAGGSIWKAIEAMPLNCDLDFFFASPQQHEVYMRIMRSIPYVNHIVSEKKNDYNTTFGFHVYDNGYNKTVPIQYVTFRYAPSIEGILEQFDFTVCQFGTDGKTLFTGDESFEHLRQKAIYFNKVHNSVATAVHLKKYLDKGFSIPTTQLDLFNKIMAESEKIRPKKPTTLLNEDELVCCSSDDDENYPPRPLSSFNIHNFTLDEIVAVQPMVENVQSSPQSQSTLMSAFDSFFNSAQSGRA